MSIILYNLLAEIVDRRAGTKERAKERSKERERSIDSERGD
jgi:hypothetical protein